jgi:EAL domain-containing protein (putative c-di-GMP-specific phosphodiesterase class I)
MNGGGRVGITANDVNCNRADGLLLTGLYSTSRGTSGRSRRIRRLSTAGVAGVLTDPSLLRLVFQPIVDLQRGVIAGYETLDRFDEPDGRPSPDTPERWFAAAEASGCGARLEAVVVR